MRRPFFCALDALAIDDRSARAGVPPRQLPACHIERVVNAAERAVVVPSVEVVVQGAARRQVLGDRGPLAARAQDIHETVGHLAQVDRPLVPAALGGRDQRGDQRPFRVGQVTWVAQLATVVATTVLIRPHQRLPPDRTTLRKSQPTPNTQDVPGWTLRPGNGQTQANAVAGRPTQASPEAYLSCLHGLAGSGSLAMASDGGLAMRSVGLALLTCL